jgi:hypothetical protein
MAIFNVTMTAPNGNSLSRPFIADDPEDAIEMASAEWDVPEDSDEFTFDVQPRPDPEGNYERLLKDAECRRLEHEFYRMPPQQSRGRWGRKLR